MRSKDQGYCERKCKKNLSCTYLPEKWIDLCLTETKRITRPFYTYHQIHSTSENTSIFCDNLYLSRLQVAAATWPCSYLFLLQQWPSNNNFVDANVYISLCKYNYCAPLSTTSLCFYVNTQNNEWHSCALHTEICITSQSNRTAYWIHVTQQDPTIVQICRSCVTHAQLTNTRFNILLKSWKQQLNYYSIKLHLYVWYMFNSQWPNALSYPSTELPQTNGHTQDITVAWKKQSNANVTEIDYSQNGFPYTSNKVAEKRVDRKWGLRVQGWVSECLDVKNYTGRLNLVWHRMLYSCTHMTTVGIKGLDTLQFQLQTTFCCEGGIINLYTA